MQVRLIIFIGLIAMLSSCSVQNQFNYRPNELNTKLDLPVLVDVEVDLSNISGLKTKHFPTLKEDIKDVVTREVEEAFFNVVSNEHVFHNIIVYVEVEKITFKQSMWPTIFPGLFGYVCLVGAPTDITKGEVEYTVKLLDDKGKMIAQYNNSAKRLRVNGLYYGGKNRNFASNANVTYFASRQAMDNIKQQIINDRALIEKYKKDQTVHKEIVYVPAVGGKPKYVFSEKSDVDKNIPATPYNFENRYALIIGNEDYSSHQVDLSEEVNVAFARNDASAFKNYAESVLGIPEENIIFMLDATTGKMNQGIAKANKIMKVTGGQAEFFVYYAGHGLPDEVTKEPYIMPVDVSGTNASQGISLKNMYAKLTEYPSKRVTVFIDACFSGGARNQGLIAARGVKIKPKESPMTGNLVVFSASSGDQSSLPYTDKEHGFFTYYLLKKLQETSGSVSYAELSDYLNEKVSLKSVLINDKEQTPKVSISSGSENIWKTWKINE